MAVQNKATENKIQVLREYTESDIKGLGVTYLLKKKTKVWFLLLVCALALTILLSRVIKPSVVGILPILAALGFFWYKSNQMGKKIWEFVKKQREKSQDKSLPVKLPF